MNDDRISALERDVARLRIELAEFRAIMVNVDNDRTKNLVSLHKDIGNIYNEMRMSDSWLTTLIYKVMPEYASVREQIDGIISLSPTPAQTDKPT